ncbi:MAG TPA: ABC-2 family transporter protein [Bacteroidota bacterium]|nr:ABC-2 family transporter protein [Bacteroidota bacterium]
MREFAAIYVQQFRTTFASFVQYRASMLIWMIWHILEPLVYLVVWSAVAAAGAGTVQGFGARDFSAYFIVLMVVNHMTYTWIFYEYEYRVRHGSLSSALLRPLHPIHADVIDNVSSKLITLPMMLLAAGILGAFFRPAIHTTGLSLLLFLPALVLAFSLRFILEWTLALAAFWTTRVSAVNQAYYVAALFLSGQMAPLALFPPAVRTAAAVLPFRWMLGFPVELFLGRVTAAEACRGIAVQAVWLGVALLLMRFAWRAGVRRYSAVGA